MKPDAIRTVKLNLPTPTAAQGSGRGGRSRFGRNMQAMTGRMKNFGRRLRRVASMLRLGPMVIAAAGAAVVGALRRVASVGDEIAKGASKLGVTTDAYQEMSYWASQNGVDAPTMERAVGRLNQRIGRAQEGNGKYAAAFDRVGVALTDVDGSLRDTEEVMGETIQRLSEVEDPATRSAQASELFGTKLARDLMPALEDGSLSLEDARNQAHDLGLVMDGDAIDASTRFTRTWDAVSATVTGMLQRALIPLLELWANVTLPAIRNHVIPALQQVASWLQDRLRHGAAGAATTFTDLVDALQGLHRWFVDRYLPAVAANWAWWADKIAPTLRDAFTLVLDGLRAAWEQVTSRFDGNSETLAVLLDVWRRWAEFGAAHVYPAIGKVLGGALELLGYAVGGAIDGVSWLIDRISQVVDTLGALRDRARNAASRLRSLVPGQARATGGRVTRGQPYLVGVARSCTSRTGSGVNRLRSRPPADTWCSTSPGIPPQVGCSTPSRLQRRSAVASSSLTASCAARPSHDRL